MSDLTRNARNGVEHGAHCALCALPSMYHMLLNVRDSLHGRLRIEIVPVLGWSTALCAAI